MTRECARGEAIPRLSTVEVDQGGRGQMRRLGGFMRGLLDSPLLCSLEWDTFDLQKAWPKLITYIQFLPLFCRLPNNRAELGEESKHEQTRGSLASTINS
jgi:hypothetical protein